MQESIGKKSFNSPSPFTHWLKPVIREAEYGVINCEYIVRKDMCNPLGVLHGGVTAGIIDDIIGATVFTMNLSHHYTTINNYIDYFSSAKGFIRPFSIVIIWMYGRRCNSPSFLTTSLGRWRLPIQTLL